MSFKKLQDLLKPNNMSSKEQGRSTPSLNKSPLSGSHHLTPLGSNMGSGMISTPPAYHNLPISQNMFYNPTVKSNDLVPPSPMIQAPFVIRPGEFNQAMHLPLNAQPEPFGNHGRNIPNDNDVSNSLNSILHQLQNHYPSQPKNLEELLQRSFSSMPSNSLFQSFHSAMPSPFIGHNTPNSHFHMSMGSEFSRGFNSNLLGTPLQNAHLFNNRNINPPQSNEALHNTLISQLAELLKQENENKIKPAIAELLLKYKALGLLPDKILDKEMSNLEDMVNFNRPPTQQQLIQQHWQVHQAPTTPQAQLQLQQAQHQQQQQQWRLKQQSKAQAQPKEVMSLPTFSLTSGLTMHPLQRNDDGKQGGNGLSDLKNSLPSHKIENTRKGLFVMEPVSDRKAGPLCFTKNNQLQQIPLPSAALSVRMPHVMSSIGSLNQELDHLTLENEQEHKMNEAVQNHKESSNKDLEALRNLLTERAELNEEVPGLYSPKARVEKIVRYKSRIGKYRSNHPVNRTFKGRSMIAGKKPRIKGKFVTLEEYMEHLKCQVKDNGEYNEGRLNWTEPLYDENLNESTTYNDSDKSLRDRDTLIKEEAS